MRRFAGIELGDESDPPRETTIPLNFRHLLERHWFGPRRFFAEVNGHLADKGISVAIRARWWDATIYRLRRLRRRTRPRHAIREIVVHEEGQFLVFWNGRAHVGRFDVDRAAPSTALEATTAEGADRPHLGRAAPRRGDLSVGRQGLVSAEREAAFCKDWKGLGFDWRKGTASGQARRDRRGDQRGHRHEFAPRSRSLPRSQAPVRSREDDRLRGLANEPRPTSSPCFRARQPFLVRRRPADVRASLSRHSARTPIWRPREGKTDPQEPVARVPKRSSRHLSAAVPVNQTVP